MGFRIRKSVKLCKGVKVNLSKFGISTSVKVGKVNYNTKRGASVNLGNGLSYHAGKRKSTSNKTEYNNQNLKIHTFENSWDKMTDRQVKYYNIFMKTILCIISILFLILTIAIPPVIIISAITGIMAYKFDANKMKSKNIKVIDEIIDKEIEITDQNDLSLFKEKEEDIDSEYNKELKIIQQKLKIAYEYNQLAMQLEKNGDIDAAIKNYEKCVELKFEGNHPYDRLAILYRKAKDYDNEIRVLKKAIELFDFLDKTTQRADISQKLEKFRTRLNRVIHLKQLKINDATT